MPTNTHTVLRLYTCSHPRPCRGGSLIATVTGPRRPPDTQEKVCPPALVIYTIESTALFNPSSSSSSAFVTCRKISLDLNLNIQHKRRESSTLTMAEKQKEADLEAVATFTGWFLFLQNLKWKQEISFSKSGFLMAPLS